MGGGIAQNRKAAKLRRDHTHACERGYAGWHPITAARIKESPSLASSDRLEWPDEQEVKPRLTGVGSLRTELEAVLVAVPSGALAADYRDAVLIRNAVGRRTAIGQKWAWKGLKPRYALDRPESEEFQAFRTAMVDPSPTGRGYACALMLARLDRLFREVTLARLSPLLRAPDTVVDRASIEDEIESTMKRGNRAWTPGTLYSVTNHILSTWKDFGLVVGSKERRTAKVHPTHATTVFAAWLGRLEGLTDRQVLASRWFALLGFSEPDVTTLMYDAARAGAIGFRAQADVIELDLPPITDRHEGG